MKEQENVFAFSSSRKIAKRCGNIAVLSPLRGAKTECALEQIPNAVGRTKHRDICPRIAVVIADNRLVCRNSPTDGAKSGGCLLQILNAVSENCDVRFAVAVVICRNRNVRRNAELKR